MKIEIDQGITLEMETANAIQQILSGDCAIVQELDGSFLIFTSRFFENTSKTVNSSLQIQEMASLGVKFWKSTNSVFKVFTPPFFKQNAEFNTPSLIKIGSRSASYSDFKFCLQIERAQLIQILKSIGGAPIPQNLLWSGLSRSNFDEDFQQITDSLRTFLIEKAVIMTSETAVWEPNPAQRLTLLLNLLLHSPPQLFIYGLWTKDEGVLGATPEILFYRSQTQIESMALAGTLPRNQQSSSDKNPASLLKDPKEIQEHLMVVEDLKEKFKLFIKNLVAKSNIQNLMDGFDLIIDPPHILELPHLFHICSRILLKLPPKARLSSVDLQLTEILHPSSALGIRSVRARTPWSWLKRLKGHQTLNRFGAPFGVTLPGDRFLSLVSIRNIEWTKQQSIVRAGCGIVSQSLPEKEWLELEAKRDSIKYLLGLKEPLKPSSEITL